MTTRVWLLFGASICISIRCNFSCCERVATRGFGRDDFGTPLMEVGAWRLRGADAPLVARALGDKGPGSSYVRGRTAFNTHGISCEMRYRDPRSACPLPVAHSHLSPCMCAVIINRPDRHDGQICGSCTVHDHVAARGARMPRPHARESSVRAARPRAPRNNPSNKPRRGRGVSSKSDAQTKTERRRKFGTELTALSTR